MYDEFDDYNDFFDRELPVAKAKKPLSTLPELLKNQVWNCGHCGSGRSIKPLHFNSVYQRTISPSGEVTEKGELMYVSPCCKGDLFIWDEIIEKEIKIDPKHFIKFEG